MAATPRTPVAPRLASYSRLRIFPSRSLLGRPRCMSSRADRGPMATRHGPRWPVSGTGVRPSPCLLETDANVRTRRNSGGGAARRPEGSGPADLLSRGQTTTPSGPRGSAPAPWSPRRDDGGCGGGCPRGPPGMRLQGHPDLSDLRAAARR